MNADEHRAEAAQHRADAQESWERSDTDGFVSQWASGINAQVADKNARIADHGGQWQFERVVLTDLDGNDIEDARIVQTRYGRRWRSDARDLWAPVEPARPSTLGKRGLAERYEKENAPAKAITWAPPGARGLAGATSVSVVIIRTDRPRSEGWYPNGEPQSR